MGRYANEQLREKCRKELEAMAEKREMSTADLDRTYKVTEIYKNLQKIGMMEEDGYSGAGEWIARGGYSRGYDRGSSYRDRDSMGRYSRDGYQMDYGHTYSGGSMQDHLDAMMRDAKTEDERRMIEEMRRKLM